METETGYPVDQKKDERERESDGYRAMRRCSTRQMPSTASAAEIEESLRTDGPGTAMRTPDDATEEHHRSMEGV